MDLILTIDLPKADTYDDKSICDWVNVPSAGNDTVPRMKKLDDFLAGMLRPIMIGLINPPPKTGKKQAPNAAIFYRIPESSFPEFGLYAFRHKSVR